MISAATRRPPVVDRLKPAVADAGPWFRVHPAANPAVRLVCFPHAGGAASAFHNWPQWLTPDIGLLAVQYPGRQERLGEPFPESIEDIAEAVVRHLEPFLDRPVALFGHSMGSLVAYEVARRLEDRHNGALARLFVSSQGTPGNGSRGTLHVQADEALVARTQSLGGPGSSAYDDPDLLPLLLPSLRADYRLVDTYRPDRLRALRAPITAFGGEADPACSVRQLASWQAATTDEVEIRVFPGDHFYLVSHAADVVGEIGSTLTR